MAPEDNPRIYKGWFFLVEDGEGSLPLRFGIEDEAQARRAALDFLHGCGAIVYAAPIDLEGVMAGHVMPGERYTKIRQADYPHRLH